MSDAGAVACALQLETGAAGIARLACRVGRVTVISHGLIHKPKLARSSAMLCLLLCGLARADEDALRYVQFVQEPTATCVARNGQQIQVKNTHPTRSLRVWLDRMHMGVGTGDRSRSDLAPGGEPEPLGCSRNLNGVQEWRVARVMYID